MNDEQRMQISHTEALDMLSVVTRQRDEARRALARVTAERDALRNKLDAALALLRDIEWDSHGFCLVCDFGEPNHAPDCALAALLEGDTDD